MSKAFDDIAKAQGWNAQSRETVLMTYIDGDQAVDLPTYAQRVADEENGIEHEGKAVPDFKSHGTGEYYGNAYPEQFEYTLRCSENADEQFVLVAEDNSGGEIVSVTFTDEDADGIQRMATTDHGLGAYEDDWQIPPGMNRVLTWDISDNPEYGLVLNESQITELGHWLTYALGETKWDWDTQGEEWN